MNNAPFFFNALGWVGAGIVLIAYGLLSMKWVDGNSISYQTLNIPGAFLLVINSYYLGAYPSVGVNAAWAGIAILTLFFDWWKGPAAAINKVASNFPKRVHLRRVTLQRIKIPSFPKRNRDYSTKAMKRNTPSDQPFSNGFDLPQLSQMQRSK